jgi:hypothetical protein
MRRTLPLLALLAFAAIGCGEIKTVAGRDGGGDGSDAAPNAADAGNPGDPLNGTWHWWIGDDAENPDSTCDVTIGGGAYEVYCPSEPYEAGTNCMKTKNDTRIQGSWLAGFDGTFDQIERYEGAGCVDLGYDTDVDIVTEGVLVMEADHAETSDAGGFLPQAFGQWDWAMWEAEDAANRIECEVLFEPGGGPGSAHFNVECLEEPSIPIPNCTETDALIIEGTIDDAQMTAEGWDESRYEGSGCDPDFPDPVVEGEHAPMGATRE